MVRKYLWRAVDQHGHVLDILIQSKRDGTARHGTAKHYVLRDTDALIITPAEGLSRIDEHHHVDPEVRGKAARQRQSKQLKVRAGREQQEPPSVPTSRPADFEFTRVDVA